MGSSSAPTMPPMLPPPKPPRAANPPTMADPRVQAAALAARNKAAQDLAKGGAGFAGTDLSQTGGPVGSDAKTLLGA